MVPLAVAVLGLASLSVPHAGPRSAAAPVLEDRAVEIRSPATASAAPAAVDQAPDEDAAARQQRIAWVRRQVEAYRLAHPIFLPRRAVAAQRHARWSNAIRPGATDAECLTQAIYYEARGESADGQSAVAQVILNRTRDGHYPKTVCGVVFQGASRPGCQFSFACEGDAQAGRINAAAWARASEGARAALAGSAAVGAGVSGATHYHTDRVAPRWDAGLAKLAQIGRHIFFGPFAHAASGSPPPGSLPSASLTAAPQARGWTDLVWGAGR